MSIEFTGTGQRLTIDSGTAIDHKSFTLLARFKITTDTTCTLFEIVTSATRLLRLWFDATTDQIKISEVYQGVTAVVGTVTTGTWFLAGMQGQDQGTGQLRLYGFVVPAGGAFSAAYVDSNQYFDQLNSIFVGTSEDDTSDWLRGRCADLSLWSSFLTQSQITAQALQQAAITSTALIGSNHFDGGNIAGAKSSNVSNAAYFDNWAAADSDGTARTDPVYDADAPAYVPSFVVAAVSSPITLPDEAPTAIGGVEVVQSALGVARGEAETQWAELPTAPGYNDVVVAVLGGWTDSPSAVTIEDTLGLTWTQRITRQYTPGGAGAHLVMWTATVTKGQAPFRVRPIITGAATLPWVSLALVEVARADLSTLIDGTPVSAIGTGTAPTVDHANTTLANVLMLAAVTYGSLNSSLSSWGGSYSTVVTKQAESNVAVGSRRVTATGNYDPSATLGDATPWVMGAMALRQQASATAPTITTTTIPVQPSATAGGIQLAATGSGPITFSISIAPSGVTVTPGGYLAWPATLADGTYSITVDATNLTGSDPQVLSLQIGATAVAPTIVTTTLPNVVSEGGAVIAINVIGTGPFTLSTTSGTPPAGLTYSSTSIVVAAGTTAGTYSWTVRATGGTGLTDDQAYTLVVYAEANAPTITTTSLATGTSGTAYSAYVAAIGTAPFAYSIIAGALAAGLTATHVIDWDVALTGAALRDAIGDPTKYHAASQGWIIPGAAGARVSANARSSVAMQRKADGAFEYAAHNLVPNSWAATPNLYVTGGVDNGAISVTLPTGVPAGSGVRSVSFTSSTVMRWESATAVALGQPFSGGVWARTASGTVTITADVMDAAPTAYVLTTTWQFLSQATASAAYTFAAFLDLQASSSGTIYVCAPRLNAGSVLCPYVPTHGAAVFAPAVRYVDNDGGGYETQAEEARTNNVRNSAMLGGSTSLPTNWATDSGATGLTWSVLGRSSLLGLPAVDVRVNGTSAAASYIALYFEAAAQIAATTGQQRTASFFVQRIAGSNTGLSNFGAGLNENTSGGVYVTGGQGAMTVDGTARRGAYTRTFSGGGTIAASLPYLFASVANGAAVDITLRIACPQEELGATATSPILCWGAATTRAEDIPVILDTSPSFISQTGGTMLAEFTPGAPGTVLQNIATIDDGTANHRIVVARQTGREGRCDIVTGGASQGPAVTTSTTAADDALSRIAFSWAPNDAVQSMNGSTAQADTSISLPTVTGMCIGNQRVGSRAVNGGVRGLYYRAHKRPAANVVELGSGATPTRGDRLLIAGTPTAAVTSALQLRAVNDYGTSPDRYLQLVINPVAASGTTGGWSKWLTR